MDASFGFFFPKHASGFRSPFTAYLAISSYADPENPKRSNIIINVFICTDPVAIVTPCR